MQLSYSDRVIGVPADMWFECPRRGAFSQTALWGVAVVLTAGLLATPNAGAADYLGQFDHIFSGTNPPAAPPPWVDVEFKDVSGGVLFKVSDVGLSPGEFVSEVDLNLNPAYDPTGPARLTFTLQGQSGTFGLPTISTGDDALKAGGDGYYDISLAFSTSNQGNGRNRFGGTDSVSYLISGIPGLQASDFVFRSSDGINGLFGEAHILGIAIPGGTSSVWADASQITPVPEPAPGILLFLGITLWAGVHSQLTRRKPA